MALDTILLAIATAFFTAVVGASVALPRIMAGKKRDEGDQKFAEAQQKMLADMQKLFDNQITSLKDSNTELSQQVSEMRGLIDKYRMQLTMTRNMLLEFEAHMRAHDMPLHEQTKQRFDDLMSVTK